MCGVVTHWAKEKRQQKERRLGGGGVGVDET